MDINAKENRKYKDSVFVDLFSEDIEAEENALSLFNALYGTHYEEGEISIRKIKIDDVLYMNFKNDVALNIEDKLLIFTEHQSTINENMPLRNLMYIGRAYEQLVPIRDRYKKNMVKIPNSEFYVFYNGKEPYPKEKVLKLSDAYKEKPESITLDLIVKVININLKEQHEILANCPILKEYMQFISKVGELKTAGNLESFKDAINYCINHNILADYLKRKGSEVLSMLKAEYDYNTDIAVQREEAEEKGMEKGKETLKQTLKLAKKLLNEGLADADVMKQLGCNLKELKEIKEILM